MAIKKSILIKEEIHKKLKVYCAEKGIKMIDLVEKLILEIIDGSKHK